MKPSILVLFATLLATQASARTWHILNDGSGDAPTVQAGIDSSVTGDTVLVHPGTYVENLNFSGKDIVLKSASGPETTILDGSGTPGPVIRLENGETSGAIIEGLTITGGTVIPSNGGGIYCRRTYPIIRFNIIRNNTGNSAGGIRLIGGTLGEAVIEGNVIEENHSENLGGGIYILRMSVTIRDNMIVRNYSPDDGGGISARLGTSNVIDNTRVVIEENVFLENVAGDKGGGLYLYTWNISEFIVERNLFLRNEAKLRISNSTGAGGGLYAEDARGSLRNNTFVGNISRDRKECGGGAIGLSINVGTFRVEYNILAFNQDCGIACINAYGARVGPNLLWANEGGDLGSSDRACPAEWASLMMITNPFFCNPGADDYTVAENSSALGTDVMGAFSEPGCGPVAVERTTWGRIKARYRSGP
jgi:hypothetical protein